MTESQQLLAQYVEEGSEGAFRELVNRYIDLVYGTALRLVDGDSQLAQDVTQTVFIHLSRKAHRLTRESTLGGWLHRDTCYVASKVMRGERRRQEREREAALMNSIQDHSSANLEKIAPVVDQAINLLGNDDRTAILLRFFEQRDFHSVGVALGTSEDAARMRASRALEKLGPILKRRGVALPATALGTALTAQAVSGAPAGLASSVAGTALASSVAAGGVAAAFFKLMTMGKIKTGIAILVAGGVATPLAIQHHTQAKLRAQNLALRQRLDGLAELNRENQKLSNLLVSASMPDDRMRELLRLRGEVALLRRLTNELTGLRNDNARLRASLAKSEHGPADGSPQPAYPTQRGRVAKIMVMPLILYASENGGRFPASFDEAAKYFNEAFKMDPFMRDAAEFTEMSKQFEIVYQGSRNDLTKLARERGIDPGTVILIRERQPWRNDDGKWVRAYGMGDGSGGIINADADGSFDTFEKKQTSSPALSADIPQ